MVVNFRQRNFAGFNCFCGTDEVGELMRSVIRPSRGGWLAIEPKAQVTRTVLRSIQEIIDFLQICRIALKLVLNDSPTPRIWRGVSARGGAEGVGRNGTKWDTFEV